MTVQNAEIVSCETPQCFGSLIYIGGPMTAREVAKASGWQIGPAIRTPWDDQKPDICPACVAGTGPITQTACPNCGGCGGSLICVYCGAAQPRDVED